MGDSRWRERVDRGEPEGPDQVAHEPPGLARGLGPETDGVAS